MINKWHRNWFCRDFRHFFHHFPQQVADWLRRPGGAGDLGSHFAVGLQRLGGLRCVFRLRGCPGLDASGARGFGVAHLGEFSESSCVRSMCSCHFGTLETTCEWSWTNTWEWWYLWRIFVGWITQRLASLSKTWSHHGHSPWEKSLGHWPWRLERFLDLCGLCQRHPRLRTSRWWRQSTMACLRELLGLPCLRSGDPNRIRWPRRDIWRRTKCQEATDGVSRDH